MKLIKFFLQHSRKIVIWSLAFGVLSGVSNALLLAVINSALKTTPSSTRLLVWSFIGLCLILPVSRFASETLLNGLGKDALYKLRMQLSQQIIGAPLLHLEQLGAHRLLATLTDDVPAITNTILVVPLLCVNSALVVGCLAYMGVLSWVLAGGPGF
jgi:putative ATP-binding cassette transporter